MSESTLFNEYGHYIGPEIPTEAVNEIVAPGPADAAVDYWTSKLNFEVPRDLAIRYLGEYGAWSLDHRNAMTDRELAETVLWLACNDLKESGEWFGLCI